MRSNKIPCCHILKAHFHCLSPARPPHIWLWERAMSTCVSHRRNEWPRWGLGARISCAAASDRARLTNAPFVRPQLCEQLCADIYACATVISVCVCVWRLWEKLFSQTSWPEYSENDASFGIRFKNLKTHTERQRHICTPSAVHFINPFSWFLLLITQKQKKTTFTSSSRLNPLGYCLSEIPHKNAWRGEIVNLIVGDTKGPNMLLYKEPCTHVYSR